MAKAALCRNKSLEEKIEEARKLIRITISKEGPHAVIFSGSPASTVMLHMIREVGGEKAGVMIFHVDLLKNHVALYQYVGKIEKLWGLEIIRETNEYLVDQEQVKEDWDEFYYRSTQKARNRMAEMCKVTHLLVPECDKRKSDKVQQIVISGHYRLFEVRPLLGFVSEEIRHAIKINNLPICPIFESTLRGGEELCGRHEELRAASPSETEIEEKEMASKLKSLGYL